MTLVGFASGNVAWLSASGILWDITGVIALARGLFFISDAKLQRQSASYWGANPSALRAFCEQRIETRFGLVQLVVGFTLQAISALGVTGAWEIFAGLIILLLLSWAIFLSSFQYWLVCDTLRLGVTDNIVERVWRKHFDDIPDRVWTRAVLNCGISFAEDK